MPDLQVVQDAQATGWLAIASTVVTAVTVGIAQSAQSKRIEAAANSAPEDVTRRIAAAERHIEEIREAKECAHTAINERIAKVESRTETQGAILGEIKTGIDRIHVDLGKITDTLIRNGGKL